MKTEEEKLEVMRAAMLDNAEIEYTLISASDNWCDKIGKTHQTWDVSDYRIKPNPEYIPFTKDDYKMFMNKIVIQKQNNTINIVTSCSEHYVEVSSTVWPYENMLSCFTFEDGTPFVN